MQGLATRDAKLVFKCWKLWYHSDQTSRGFGGHETTLSFLKTTLAKLQTCIFFSLIVFFVVAYMHSTLTGSYSRLCNSFLRF